MSSEEHQSNAAQEVKRDPVRCAVLTISDTRTIETDTGGMLVLEYLRQANVKVVAREIVRDEPEAIREIIETWIADAKIQAILTTGGTGIAKRDTTIDIVRPLLTHEIEGFGELFRMLSWEQVKGAAMMSRAVGGLVARDPDQGGDTFIFSMPGSTNAVETAMANLIAPQLAHLVWERTKQVR